MKTFSLNLSILFIAVTIIHVESSAQKSEYVLELNKKCWSSYKVNVGDVIQYKKEQGDSWKEDVITSIDKDLLYLEQDSLEFASIHRIALLKYGAKAKKRGLVFGVAVPAVAIGMSYVLIMYADPLSAIIGSSVLIGASSPISYLGGYLLGRSIIAPRVKYNKHQLRWRVKNKIQNSIV